MQTSLDQLFAGWHKHVEEIVDWRTLVTGITARITGCGKIYELRSPRSNYSYAIADMRDIPYAHPHYHANGETEFYFVLQGRGRVLLGQEVISIHANDSLVIPPGIAHCVLSPQDLVLAVVNTPPFNPQNCIDLFSSNDSVKYDHEQFQQLIATAIT